MALDPLVVELLALALLQFLSSVAGSVAKLGSAVLFSIGWNLAALAGVGSGSMTDVAIYMTIQQVVSSPVQAWQLRKNCSMLFVALVAVLWICSEAVGTQLMVLMGKSVWLKRSLGVMLLLIFIYETSNHWAAALNRGATYMLQGPGSLEKGVVGSVSMNGPPETYSMKERRNVAKAICLGVVGGFLRGLFNVPLVALLLFALYAGMPKDEWRANMSVIMTLTSLGKAYVLFIQQDLWDGSNLPQYVTSAVIGLMAIPVGDRISTLINPETFRQGVTWLLGFGSLMLATHGTGTTSVFLIWALALVSLLGLFAVWCHRRHFKPELHTDGSPTQNSSPGSKEATASSADITLDPVMFGAGDARPRRTVAGGSFELYEREKE